MLPELLRHALVDSMSPSAPAPAAHIQHARKVLSDDELHIVHIVIVVCNSLSIFGCAFILWHFLRSARARRYATSMSQRMVVMLSLLDLSYSLPKIFPTPQADSDKLACDAQGFALEFTGLMSVVWNCCMAHSLYRKVVHRDSEAMLLTKFKLYICITVIPAFVASICLLAGDMYSDAIFYCWVGNKKWYLPALYIWVVLAIVYVCVVLFMTQMHVAKRARRQGNLDAIESSWLIMLKLRIYMVAFVVLWLPSAVFRLFGEWMGGAKFALAIVMQATLCSQGFATSVIYGGLTTKLLALCRRKPPTPAYKVLSSPPFPFDATSNGEQLSSFGRPASMFVSTFNMGEGKLNKTDLAKWIPLGYDIYVIGVQECLHLSDTRAQIRQHIEGRASPTAPATVPFHQFKRQIGSRNTSLGYHGHIAISVYIRSEDVESGAFYMPPAAQQEVNCGKSLVVARASNKGAVGIAFRYHDTSFAFATCHLSSDSKGRSKIARRNRDAVDMLNGLHLNAEDVGFEFPLMHHHSFVLGDLNYRLTHRNASPSEILELVANVHRSEQSVNGAGTRTGLGSNAMSIAKKRWSTWRSGFLSDSALLRSGRDTRADTIETASLDVSMIERHGTAGGADADGDGDDSESIASVDEFERIDEKFIWDDVFVHDELKSWMAAAQIFFGFREAPIAFPPSYRRKRGTSLKPDAKWTPAELAKQYTTSVKGAGERVPSYTDRILFASQRDLASRLHCSLYTLCEEVKCSDHKPVVAVFHARVNRQVEPMPKRPPVPPRKWRRMQNIRGVYECTLKITFDAIRWKIHPAFLVAAAASTTDNDSNASTRASDTSSQHHIMSERRLAQAFLTVVFPLPSEDIFSEQRKLHELADALSGGVYSDHSDEQLLKSNVAHRKWVDFVRDGIVHTTFARVTDAMHVALKVHLGGAVAQCFGQGVVSIPREAFDSGAPSTFELNLSVGGKCTGTLCGSLRVALAQHSGSGE